MADKRIIEQNASTTVPDDAYFIFDSALLGTFKISQSALLDFFGNATITEVTKAQYDALPDTKLTDGVLYAIKDQETSYVVDIEVNGGSILDEDGIADLSVISKIEEEIANAIAEEYDSTHTYYSTGLVFHEGVLYQCTATSVTGTWDSTKWNVVDIKDLLDNVSTNIGYLWNTISNTIAGIYDTSSTYNTGDYAIYSLKLYRCKDDGVTGAWNSSKWEEVNIPEYIDYVLENAGKVDDVKVDGTSVVTNKVAEIEIPVKDVQVKTDSTYDSVVDASGNAKIDLSSVTAYGEVPNLPQAIATFKDGADAPMKSLKVAIEPQQDLHGYDAPWVGGAGKNKLAMDISDIKNLNTAGTWNGNTYTINGAEYKINIDTAGNITSINARSVASNPNGDLKIATTIPADSYILSSGFTETNGTNDTFLQKNGVTIARGNDSSPGTNFTITELSEVVLHIRLSRNDSSFICTPMVRLATVTDSSFAPYSNICPISGWTGCEVIDDVVYGGFIEWNQLVQNGDFNVASSSGWGVNGGSIRISNNTATITISNESTECLLYRQDLVCPATHKFIFICDFKCNGVQAHTNISGYTSGWQTSIGTVPTKSYGNIEYSFFTPSSKNLNILYIYKQNGQSGDILAYKNIMIIDLTQAFGETKANEIYAMEQAEAGSGIAYFKSLFYKGYYPYNSGEITNISAVNGDTDKYTTTTIPFTDSQGQSVEVFGGEVDVVNGIMTVDRASVDLGTLNWALENGIFRLNESIGAKLTADTSAVANMLCSVYKTVSQNAMGSTTTDQCIAGLNWSNGVRVKDSNYTDVTSFKTAMNGVQLVYELATPQTIQLTPTQVNSLLGSNNVWADTGDINECVYRRDMSSTINDIIARLEALEG